MWVLFQSVMLGLTGSIAARVLTALGIGIFSYAAITTVVNTLIANVNTSYASMGGVVLAFMNISGFGTALSIITSALVTRASLIAIKKMMPV